MRFAVTDRLRSSLVRSAAIFVVGGLAAGCSSDVMRFQDSILTGSSRPTPQPAPMAQAYPGDYANVDQTHTGSVGRSARSMNIFSRSSLIPRPAGDVGVAGAPVHNPYPGTQQAAIYQPAPVQPVASAPVQRSSLLDPTVTGSTPPASAPVRPAPVQVAQPAAIIANDGQGGWSRAGGTSVTVRQGETVQALSRRFGVPADAILRANGLANGATLAAGQQVIIPSYGQPGGAPDQRPNVPAQQDRVAVLPQQPKLKEGEPGAVVASSNTQRGSAASGGTYTVVSGDTLDAIARRNGTTTAALKQANGLDSGLIRIGQRLTIPGGGSAPVQVVAAPRTDATTTASVATTRPAATTQQQGGYTPPQTSSVIQQASLDTTAPAPDATGIGKMRWPVRGRVISGFGSVANGKKNDGIDIAVPAGTPVKAAENGVVIYAGDGLKEFGNTVLVRHEDGLVTVYGHAGEIKVQRGQKVRRGEDLALAGMSGSAETPKLHFEVRKDSAPVDPVKFLE